MWLQFVCVLKASRALVLILLCSLLCSNVPVFCKSNLVERPRRDLLPQVGLDNLSASDRELAEQLEIWSLLSELYNKQQSPDPARQNILRQKIRETILESYFDAAAFQAEADREAAHLEALRQTLISRRERNVEINNATNFIGAGTLNTIGSVLGFSASTPPFSGNLLQMLSGVMAAGMSTYALKQNAGGKTRGQGNSTVIAELFGRPTDDRSNYPESVWRFVHGKSLDDPSKTRVQLLEEKWIEKHELEKHGSRHELQKIDEVSGIFGAKKTMSLDDLNDEIKMISDISELASLMTHHLRDLIRLIDSDLVI